MCFETLWARFSLPLRQMTWGLGNRPRFIDQQDLMQEALCHLWERWNKGELTDKTENYILTSCRFHLKNYLRKEQERVKIVSLYTLAGNGGTTLEEIIPEESFSSGQLDAKLMVDQIRGDGLTSREKEVFELRLEGYTVREIGERIGISHPRVVKLLSSVRSKWKDRMEI